MFKKEIEQKKHIKIDSNFDIPEDIKINHDLIEKIENLYIKGILDYQESIKCLTVTAKIKANISAIDARDGKNIILKDQEFDWNDDYFFSMDKENGQENIVFGEEFDILNYAIEQIVLNIPMNLTNNYGKISFVGKDYVLLTEEEYQQEQDQKIDHRWEKLKDYKFDK